VEDGGDGVGRQRGGGRGPRVGREGTRGTRGGGEAGQEGKEKNRTGAAGERDGQIERDDGCNGKEEEG